MASVLANAIQIGDGLAGGVVLRGPRVSRKWAPGKVFYEVEMPDGRMRQKSYDDTERVEVSR